MEYNSLHDVHKRRRNRAAAPIGALVLLLAAAGLVALIYLGVNMTSQILDNSHEKQKFEKIVQPVLMFDPPPFEDITTLPPTTLLESALWATMLGEKRETYTFDPQSNLILPSSDVDVSAANLFGPQVKLEHMSFPSDFGISYEYDETTKAYHIPVMSATALYTPRVDEIEREGDIYALLVGYIPPGTAWNTDLAGKKTEPDPHKFMVYKLQKVEKHYQLIAIEEPPPEKQVVYGNPEAQDQIASVGDISSEGNAEGSSGPDSVPAQADAGGDSEGTSTDEWWDEESGESSPDASDEDSGEDVSNSQEDDSSSGDSGEENPDGEPSSDESAGQ